MKIQHWFFFKCRKHFKPQIKAQIYNTERDSIYTNRYLNNPAIRRNRSTRNSISGGLRVSNSIAPPIKGGNVSGERRYARLKDSIDLTTPDTAITNSQNSIAPQSFLDNSCTISKNSWNRHTRNYIGTGSQESLKAPRYIEVDNRRDVHSALRDRLKKVEKQINAEVNTIKKQRRTRKQRESGRGKCNKSVSNNTMNCSAIQELQNDLGLCFNEGNAVLIHKQMKSKMKPKNAWDVSKKAKDPVYYITTKAARPVFNNTTKIMEVPSLRDLNSKRYLARKYLEDLYKKIIHRVRRIERTKKMNGPLKDVKVVMVIDQMPSKKQNSYRQIQQSFHPLIK